MRLLTLNIQPGGGTRVQRILDAIADLLPSVVVLTEYRENQNGVTIRTRLFGQGYRWQASGSVDPKMNTVFLASKEPFAANGVHADLGPHSHRMLFARFSDFDLIAAYFPQGEKKRPVFEYLTRNLRPQLRRDGVVIGDLNTGRPYLDEVGRTFACVDAFEAVERCGLVDSWRSRHPDAAEFSWYTAAENGFRIDHAFCTRDMDRRITNVQYVHGVRENRVTDHSAMVIDFDDRSSHDAFEVRPGAQVDA